MVNISVYNLRVIKEKSGRYDVKKNISSPKIAAKIFNDVLELDTRSEEVLALMTLDTKNKITGLFIVSQGSINSSIVTPREIFKRAILQNSNGIIIAHNHPSGDPSPSKEDVNITHRIKEAGKIIGIDLLDHIIIGDDRWTSFKEKALL